MSNNEIAGILAMLMGGAETPANGPDFDPTTSEQYFRKGFPFPLERSETVKPGTKIQILADGPYFNGVEDSGAEWDNYQGLSTEDIYEVQAAYSVDGEDEMFAVFLKGFENPAVNDEKYDTEFGEVYLVHTDFKVVD